MSRDTFTGFVRHPLSLNKYTYGNGNPINMIDPSGYVSLAQLGTSSNIHKILTFMDRVESGLNFMDAVLNGDIPNINNKQLGMLVLVNLGGKSAIKLTNTFTKRCKIKKKKSFVEGTLVHSEQGLIPIEKVKIGDKVWSWNEENKEISLKEITHIIESKNTQKSFILHFENGENIEATENHQFWLGNKWEKIQYISEGNLLTLINKKTSPVEAIFVKQSDVAVYNLTVDFNHNYYVTNSGILSKNSECIPDTDFSGYSNVSNYYNFTRYPEQTPQKYRHERLPEYGAIQDKWNNKFQGKQRIRTNGILEILGIRSSLTNVDLASGKKGPSKYIHGSGFRRDDHVEMHAIGVFYAIEKEMKKNIDFGVLHINNEPCSEGLGNCETSLKYMVPKDKYIILETPSGRRPFYGLPF